MKSSRFSTRDLARVAMGVALIAVCSWLSIPMTVPFTLQTFAVCLVTALFGLRLGLWTVVCYLLLGAVGAPVFAGFNGGLSALMGPTGGYIVGFLGSALIYWLLEKLLGKKIWIKAVSMVLGLLFCYALGTIWFYIVYNNGTGTMGWGVVLAKCVIPFIPVDLIKIVLALILSETLGKILKKYLD